MYTDGIIFDMDGTVWDTCKEVADSWTITAEKYVDNVSFSVELIKSCMGLVMEDFARKAMPQVEDEALRLRILKECTAFENGYIKTHGTTLYPKVLETLEKLAKKCPLFIVSNCQAGYIETFLDMYHVEGLFKDFENPGRTGLAKAENIRLVCERNGLKAPVYVGDTQGDLDACMKAGVPFVYAAYGFGTVNMADCAAKVDSFEALDTLFEAEKSNAS